MPPPRDGYRWARHYQRFARRAKQKGPTKAGLALAGVAPLGFGGEMRTETRPDAWEGHCRGGQENRATCTGLRAPWLLTRLGFLPAVVAAPDGVEAAAAIEAFLFHRVNEGVHDAVHLFRSGVLDHMVKVPIGLCRFGHGFILCGDD